jgi:hypothetical protein
VVIIPVATSMATLSAIADVTHLGNVLSLGEILSGWRDLNSRPLDPQESDSRYRPCPRVLRMSS